MTTPKARAPEHIHVIEALIRSSETWALVDNPATKVSGGLAERHRGDVREAVKHPSEDQRAEIVGAHECGRR